MNVLDAILRSRESLAELLAEKEDTGWWNTGAHTHTASNAPSHTHTLNMHSHTRGHSHTI